MTTDQELIQSGNLEAYVCGVLPQDEMREISQRLKGNQILRNEVELIENCYMKLAQGLAPDAGENDIFDRLLQQLDTKGKTSKGLSPYIGWAAAFALLLLSGYLYTSLDGMKGLNQNLEQQVTSTQQEKQFLESEIEDVQGLNQSYEEALAFIKDKNTVKVNLAGQGDFASTSAVAFHNAEQDVTYLDLDQLPEVPDGKTYQLWSLTLNPLTPTSLGVVAKDDTLLKIENPYTTEAFGITLEPAGGSESPTLEQLYTLGVIPSQG